MSQQNETKSCYYSCSCTKVDCSFKHYLEDSKERLLFKERVFDKVYDREKHNETDPKGCRHAPCRFGVLCGRKDCDFKHGVNDFGREAMNIEWRRFRSQGIREKLFKEVEDLIPSDPKAALEKLAELKKMCIRPAEK